MASSLLAAVVPAAERRRNQAVGRQGHQLLAVETQKAGGVAGNHTPNGRQQARVAVLRCQRGGEIAGDLEQGADLGLARLPLLS
jgi:hypothetical protein